MNAEFLLEHYHRIADAPDAIGRLRRFILDLAVRGKLVPQDVRDEPAAGLLKRIEKRKAELIKSGQGKQGKPLPPVHEDTPFAIPKTWRWTRLGTIASYIQRGKSPKYAVSDGSQVVSQKCVQWLGLDLSVARQITIESLSNYEDVRFLRHGDLLWNSTGTGTIGRIIRVINPPEKLVCDSHVTVVRCATVDPEYIRTWLRSDHVYAQIEDRAAGSTNQVELTAHMAVNQVVPLPPLAEQHRIVAKVDELMTLCDQLETARAEREATRNRLAAASLARLNAPDLDPTLFANDARFALDNLPALATRPDQIKQIRQTILNLAVRGKLVPQDVKDAPPELRRDACESFPDEIPGSWFYARLIHLLAEDTRNGYSRKPDDAFDGVPLLRISAGTVRRDGIVAEEEHKFISGIDESTRTQYGLKAGDLLACRFNGNKASVGRLTVFIDYLGLAPIYPDKLIRVRVAPKLVVPAFLQLVGDSDIVRHEVEALCATTVGNWGISASNLKRIHFPVPPLAEQHRIVAKVDALMALCDQLEASLAAAETTRRRLLEALLAEALLAEALAPAERERETAQ